MKELMFTNKQFHDIVFKVYVCQQVRDTFPKEHKDEEISIH